METKPTFIMTEVDVSYRKIRFMFHPHSAREPIKPYSTFKEKMKDGRMAYKAHRPHFFIREPRFTFRSPYWSFHVFYGIMRRSHWARLCFTKPIKRSVVLIENAKQFLEVYDSPRSDIHV